ncbi:killer cell lectin-like receptor subfamily B member 1B allele C isoform X2 [Phyllobates terribilis]|uniref:killer cell lectin-like receptor subfamily B member 1B allele C isoform X2 n=1 Tax=Phyllobates terribilis TaxID=111132 RepID=UPI003CCA99F8
MAENITYAEMNLTTGKGKRQKTDTVHLQDETLGVTYAAVKRLPTSKKEKSSKGQKGIKDLVTNATTPVPDSGIGEDNVTYAALMGMKTKESKKGEETEKDQLEEKWTSDTYLAVKTNEEHRDWKQRIFQGKRCYVLLVPSLAVLCLVLLITTIYGFHFCAGDTPMSGNGSGASSAADSFSPCSDPWILISNKCYRFSENQKSQKESEDDCEKQNAQLAMKLVKITKQEFWIGLMSRGTEHQGEWTGKWADGSIEIVTKGQGTCVKISDGRLALHNCHQELHWICEKKPPQ